MHKHHILPKYRRGSNDPSNLVSVSVTQHAMFHFCNWQLWQDKRDWLAWKGLMGEVEQEEIIKQLRLKGLEISNKKGSTPARVAAARKSQPLAVASATSPEAKAKRKQTFANIQHQKGEKNSQHGTMWISNGDTNKKIKKNEPIPEGYYLGRKLK